MKVGYEPLYMFVPSLWAGKAVDTERIKEIPETFKTDEPSQKEKAPQEIQWIHDSKEALYDSYDWLGNLTGTRLTLQKVGERLDVTA